METKALPSETGAEDSAAALDPMAKSRRLAQEQNDKFSLVSRKTVLVVDDDAEMRKLIRKLLEAKQIRVMEEVNGKAALRTAARQPINLVLLDIQMPGIDGITTCKYLRANVNLEKQIPILMVSSMGDRRCVSKCIMAGANDYLLKPFTPELLIEKVEKLLV